MLLEGMKLKNKKVMSKEELMQWAATSNDKLVIMAGAGDIYVCINQVQEIFTQL